MAAFGIKAIQPQDNEHIFGFSTARGTADMALLEVWNGPTQSDLRFTVDKEGQLQTRDGSAARPTYSFESDKDSGRYMSAAGTFLDVIAGTAVGTWTAGKLALAGDLEVGDDVTLKSDAAVLNFGADSDVSLTHVADTGLLLNSTRQLQFNDSTQYIAGTSGTVLSIAATDEIDLTATAVDLNGTLDVSGVSTLTGNVTMSADASVGDDLTLGSDGAILNFGADSDVNLTHVADTGLLLNSTRQIQFNDSSQYIAGTSATVLSIAATDEIDLTATAIDLNGTLDVSGTLTVAGNADLNGDLDVDGTSNLDIVDIDGAVDMASTLQVDGAITGSSTIEGTTITATTAFVPDASDGAALGTTSLEFSDLYLADGAVIAFGDDQEVTLTHVADTGLLLSDASGIGTTQLQFGDSGTYIHQSADGVLDLVADTEIEINATTIDVNGALDVSGTITGAGVLSIDDTTDTTSGTSGSIHTDGGLGVAKALWVATTSRFVGVTTHGDDVVSDTDSTDDLGTTGVRWANLWVDDVVATTTVKPGTLVLAAGSITDTSGAIDFGNENLVTTGTLGSGAITGSSTLTLAGNADLNGDLDVDGTANLDIVDIDGAVDMASTLTLGADLTVNAGAVFNEASADVDFRVESNGQSSMFFVDGGNDRVGIKTSTPSALLDIGDATNTYSGDMIIKDSGNGGLFITDDTKYLGFWATHGGSSLASATLGSRSNHALSLMTNDTKALTIDTSQNVLVELTAAETLYTLVPKLQVETTGSDAGLSAWRNEDGAGGPYLFLGKSRGTSVNADTLVEDDDVLGSIMFVAADGVDRGNAAASIIAYIDGTPGENDTPGRLQFNTSADGSGSPTARMTILSDGKVGIGEAVPDCLLHIKGAAVRAADSSSTLVLEGAAGSASNAGVNILSTGTGNILFGDAGNSGIGKITYTHSSNALTITTADATAVTIDSSQNVGIGVTAIGTALLDPASQLTVKGPVFVLTNTDGGYNINNHTAGTTGGTYTFYKSRQGDYSPPATNADDVVNGDTLGSFVWYSYSNSQFNESIRILGQVDGTFTSNQKPPGRIVFQTGISDGAMAEAMRITSTQKVGIGTTSPDEALHVVGGQYITSPAPRLYMETTGDNVHWKVSCQDSLSNTFEVMSQAASTAIDGSTWTNRFSVNTSTVTAPGNFTCVGTKSFTIPHPLPEKTDTHMLAHSSIEGPRVDLIYRGSADLVSGLAQVDLDEAAGMTEGTWNVLCRDPQVWVQNESGWDAVRGSVAGSTLSIECAESDSNDNVSWMVVAERCDQNLIINPSTDDEGRLIVEPEKEPEEEEDDGA
jgi:cytoskeletal protein CcmA (bactofilin family)